MIEEVKGKDLLYKTIEKDLDLLRYYKKLQALMIRP